MSSPYRIIAQRDAETAESRKRMADICPDVDLLPVLGPFWLASIVRVVAFIARHERAQMDVTLASLAVLFIPLLLLGSARFALRRVRRASHALLARLFTLS